MPLNGKFLDKNGLTYLWSKLKALFSSKQDTISDLGTIRSGAEAGATAVQPAALAAETSAREAADSKMRVALIQQVDEGSKNKCKITATTQTFRNLTLTVDAERGTITVNGTANATDSIIISDIIATTEEMFLTGTPSEASGYNIRFGSASTYRDTGSGVSIPSGLSNAIYFAFNSRTVFNNVVLNPMICTAADYAVSSAFVPYRPSWQEMYDMIKALQSGGTSTQSTASLMTTIPGKSAEITAEDEPEEIEI